MQAMPSPRSTSEAPALRADDSMRAAEIGDAGMAGLAGMGSQLRRSTGLKHCGAVGRVPGRRCAARERAAVRRRADGEAERSHAGDGLGDAGRIPHFKWPELPVEAGAHGGVDGRGIVGDFADAVGGEVPQRREKRPKEFGGFVFGGVVGEQQAQALFDGGRIFRHVERGQRGLDGWRGIRRC